MQPACQSTEPLDRIEGVVRAKRLPVVLTRQEVGRVMGELEGISQTIALLLYGSGLRMLECLRLRVKDIDFDRRELTVRQGKGDTDRRTMLPESSSEQLRAQIETVRRLHERDLARGFGTVELPHALQRKLPSAAREFRWQYVFPATTVGTNRRNQISPNVPM
jgi:integrase